MRETPTLVCVVSFLGLTHFVTCVGSLCYHEAVFIIENN